MRLAVSTYRYRSQRSDEPLTRLVELAREKPRFGYRRLHVLLRPGGERVNHKRLHRIYREAGLVEAQALCARRATAVPKVPTKVPTVRNGYSSYVLEKMVSAEGIESAKKRRFNNIQSDR
jgi:putative transposase